MREVELGIVKKAPSLDELARMLRIAAGKT